MLNYKAYGKAVIMILTVYLWDSF